MWEHQTVLKLLENIKRVELQQLPRFTDLNQFDENPASKKHTDLLFLSLLGSFFRH